MNNLEKYITRLLPDNKRRLLYLEIFKEIILYANSLGVEKWGVHCKAGSIRFLVGGLIIATIHENSVWLALDAELLASANPDIVKAIENDWDTGKWAFYRAIETKNLFYTDSDLKKWELIKSIHLEVIKKASKKYNALDNRSRKSISFEFISYLNVLFNCSIPFPTAHKTTNIDKYIVPSDELKLLLDMDNKIKNTTPKVQQRISKQIERGTIAQKIKSWNKFECQICKELDLNPLTFRKTNGEYYIETHHVIEVALLRQGTLGLSNLVTVCPNHHRQLHFGNAKLVEDTNEVFIFQIDEKVIKIKKIKIEITDNK